MVQPLPIAHPQMLRDSLPAYDLRYKSEAQRDVEVFEWFSGQMWKRLEKAGRDGKSNWHSRELCSFAKLRNLLEKAVEEGDWVSAANYAMMLGARAEWERQDSTAARAADFGKLVHPQPAHHLVDDLPFDPKRGDYRGEHM